ncbi:hypothetical protein [Arthrobacter sp.]|uniref:hypothetical protein n=1 Tax=Arthrobacter sp. TaxID=1667 RepID=UPI00281144D0|nr:hypothetical protein [Arthrobacter sp.]
MRGTTSSNLTLTDTSAAGCACCCAPEDAAASDPAIDLVSGVTSTVTPFTQPVHAVHSPAEPAGNHFSND